MGTLAWIFAWLFWVGVLAFWRVGAQVLLVGLGIALGLSIVFSPFAWWALGLMCLTYAGIATVLLHPKYRQEMFVDPVYRALKPNMPKMSETEAVALEAGTVSWDGELFSGKPNWEKLLSQPSPQLSAEEQAFIEGPLQTLCEMLDEWEITHERLDLPQPVWDFLKSEGFFSFIIPKAYGGLEFSAFAHSEILTVIAGRSLTAACIVAVPNSLGPAELLLHYGTQSQRDYYLPRLAKGLEIPCFALTGPESGSDATSIPDEGVVCHGTHNGEQVLGIEVTWDKRYITLAPVATLLGLAFQLRDPDHLLGDKDDIGITCALIPTNTPGVIHGERHFPVNIPFQNGPTQGEKVFIPLEWVIGGPEMVGQGWRMLVDCLSVGRAISLPSSSSGGQKMAAFSTGAYAQIRRQFRLPIAAFEGVQEALARIAGFTYLSESTRKLTVGLVDQGEKPSLPGAISKYHVTEFGRKVAIDAMDVHAGKGIMMGPNNYIGRFYQGAPIGITVEGANILTRNLIIFGQGAMRCHPYAVKMLKTFEADDKAGFEKLLFDYIGFLYQNGARSLWYGFTFARLSQSSFNGAAKTLNQDLTRASSAYAVAVDAAMAIYGGKLKFKESQSARLGDMLSALYMGSAVMKSHYDAGQPTADEDLIAWVNGYLMHQFWQAMRAFIDNLPNRLIRGKLRFITMPLGAQAQMPKDHLNRAVSQLLTQPSATRERIVGRIFVSDDPRDGLNRVKVAYERLMEAHTLVDKLHDAAKRGVIEYGPLGLMIQAANKEGLLSGQALAQLEALDEACSAVVAVDSFDHDTLLNGRQSTRGDVNEDNPADFTKSA